MRTMMRRAEGNAFVEYALLLLLLTGGCLAAYGAVSIISSYGFAVDFVGGSGGVSVASGPTRTGVRPVQSRSGSAVAEGRTAWFDKRADSARWLVSAAIWTIAIVGGVLLWRALRRKRRVGREEAEVFEPLPPGHEQLLFAKRQQLCALLAKSLAEGSAHGPEVRRLASEQLVAVKPGTSVKTIRQLMQSNRIRHLLVVGRELELLGIISDRDVQHRPGRTAADIMTRSPIVIPPNIALVPAITVMLKHAISCLPIVEGGRVLGILTTTDLMLSLQSAIHLFAKRSAESSLELTWHETDYQPVCEAATD